MQPNEAPVAGLVDAGDRIPGRRRRLAVDAQITLAAAFDDGMTHVDRDDPAICPLRNFQISAAASPAAAMLVCAAAATRNDDGSCGSSPVSVTASSAAGSPPARVQRSARICLGLCMSVALP